MPSSRGQAQIIAYIDDYKLLMIATLGRAPRCSWSSRSPPAALARITTMAVE